MRKFLLCFLLFFCVSLLLGQQQLPEVIVSDIHLSTFSKTVKKTTINDSVALFNNPLLTQTLNQNSLLFFKENGNAMVSSVAFRGSTAQQTAVVWNGININSQLNGQTDFNTINTRNFSDITIKSGGGSTVYGTSAIGGSIHLNNSILFNTGNSSKTIIETGSFNTYAFTNTTSISKKNWTLQFGVSKMESKNDYPILTNNTKNVNGEFNNLNFNLNFGYLFSKNNSIYFYSNLISNNRNLSPAIQSVSNSKYKNLDTRNMFEWKSVFTNFSSSLKIASLTENYQFFQNKSNPKFSFGNANSIQIKYDIGILKIKNIQLNTIYDFIYTKGTGSDLLATSRKINSFSQLIKYKITSNVVFEGSIRKEITNSYKSSVLYSLGAFYKPFSFYELKLNSSKNFRIPSFNDLYWQQGGNPNLFPETAFQNEITQTFSYKKNSISFTGFQSKIKQLIQWQPDLKGIWSPENVFEVKNYGFEIEAKSNIKLKNSQLKTTFLYGYTFSENIQLQKQLIYVPNHKWIINTNYNYKNWFINYQFTYTGIVFTTSDNKNSLPDYAIHNSQFGFYFIQKKHQLSLQIANFLNENYQSVLNRPLPGKNYNLQLIFTL